MPTKPRKRRRTIKVSLSQIALATTRKGAIRKRKTGCQDTPAHIRKLTSNGWRVASRKCRMSNFELESNLHRLVIDHRGSADQLSLKLSVFWPPMEYFSNCSVFCSKYPPIDLVLQTNQHYFLEESRFQNL